MSEARKVDITERKSKEITVVDDNSILSKIYVVRGVQVMLDFELAEIYGYTTSAFNQQVRRNAIRFPDDFRFQLSKDELDDMVKSQFVISQGENKFKGQDGGTRYLPWAFTEQGIYMLMTVLKGDLAINQSIALIRTFKAMKDYIVQNQGLIDQHNYLRLSIQSAETQKELAAVHQELQSYGDLVMDHDKRLIEVMEQLSDTVRKSELSPYLLDFNKSDIQREYLFLNGQPLKADDAYVKIYGEAKHTIHIVDDYIGVKTLNLLQDIGQGVSVVIFSDNKANMSARIFADFQTEFPRIPVRLIKNQGIAHDRFIVLDYGTEDERVFHCGASSKDAGKKVTAITEFQEGTVKNALHDVISKMLKNPPMTLV